MALLVVEDAYEEFEEIRKFGLLDMAARQSVRGLAVCWFGPDCALARLTAEDYYNLLRTYSDWQAQKEVR